MTGATTQFFQPHGGAKRPCPATVSMDVPSRTSAPTPALDRTFEYSDHPREGAPTFTPPHRGSSTGSDHCSTTGLTPPQAALHFRKSRFFGWGNPTAERVIGCLHRCSDVGEVVVGTKLRHQCWNVGCVPCCRESGPASRAACAPGVVSRPQTSGQSLASGDMAESAWDIYIFRPVHRIRLRGIKAESRGAEYVVPQQASLVIA